MNNAKVQAALVDTDGALEIMQHVGFVLEFDAVEGQEEGYLIFPEHAELEGLQRAVDVLSTLLPGHMPKYERECVLACVCVHVCVCVCVCVCVHVCMCVCEREREREVVCAYGCIPLRLCRVCTFAMLVYKCVHNTISPPPQHHTTPTHNTGPHPNRSLVSLDATPRCSSLWKPTQQCPTGFSNTPAQNSKHNILLLCALGNSLHSC